MKFQAPTFRCLEGEKGVFGVIRSGSRADGRTSASCAPQTYGGRGASVGSPQDDLPDTVYPIDAAGPGPLQREVRRHTDYLGPSIPPLAAETSPSWSSTQNSGQRPRATSTPINVDSDSRSSASTFAHLTETADLAAWPGFARHQQVLPDCREASRSGGPNEGIVHDTSG